jgi:hypothetical protein
MLPPGCNYLFPRCRKQPNKDGYYFDNAPMGHNKLGKMMTELSQKAGLSRKYTNHSLRATSVHLLDAAQFPSRHIMSVTGHKAETSLKTYTGYTSENTKRSMSEAISNGTGIANANKKVKTARNTVPRTSANPGNSVHNEINFSLGDCELAQLSNSQMDNILHEFEDENVDEILRSISIPNHVSHTTNSTLNVNHVLPMAMYPFCTPTINAQNVTINYNIFQK